MTSIEEGAWKGEELGLTKAVLARTLAIACAEQDKQKPFADRLRHKLDVGAFPEVNLIERNDAQEPGTQSLLRLEGLGSNKLIAVTARFLALASVFSPILVGGQRRDVVREGWREGSHAISQAERRRAEAESRQIKEELRRLRKRGPRGSSSKSAPDPKRPVSRALLYLAETKRGLQFKGYVREEPPMSREKLYNALNWALPDGVQVIDLYGLIDVWADVLSKVADKIRSRGDASEEDLKRLVEQGVPKQAAMYIGGGR